MSKEDKKTLFDKVKKEIADKMLTEKGYYNFDIVEPRRDVGFIWVRCEGGQWEKHTIKG